MNSPGTNPAIEDGLRRIRRANTQTLWLAFVC